MSRTHTHAPCSLYRTIPQVQILKAPSHETRLNRGRVVNLLPSEGPRKINNRLPWRAMSHWVENVKPPSRSQFLADCHPIQEGKLF